MKPPVPSATQIWHNDTYPAISPSRPELSAAGKTVIIIGAGSGIGRETAIAFSTASAARVVLLGRDETKLKETASRLPPAASALVHAVDITQEGALRDVAAVIGKWDIIVMTAGYVSTPSSIASSNVDEWWQSFETNVKGTLLVAKAFLPTANSAHATLLALTSGYTAAGASMLPGLSAYMSSKLALVKAMEFIAAENPNIHAATIHPGMVETAIFTKSGAKADVLPTDTVQLPAHFLVWMCSSQAEFLKGRSVWANWDIEELKAQAQAIQSGNEMTSGIYGWPYPNM